MQGCRDAGMQGYRMQNAGMQDADATNGRILE
jgi:hypothetical protein